MKTENSKQELINVLKNMFIDTNVYNVLSKELVETGKMTNIDVKSIINYRTDLNNVRKEVLVWLYKAILKYNTGLPKIEYYFEDEEIKQAEYFSINRNSVNFPLKFFYYKKLEPKDDYLISLTAKEINSLLSNGIIILNPEIQRESTITTYNGQLVSSISYNDKRAREISIEINNNNYHPDTARLILIIDGEEDYIIDENNKEIIINSGNIALLDGNHRFKGIEYSVFEIPDIVMDMPIIFSFGTVKDGKQIISQTEKRQPLKKEHVKTYEKTNESDIVRGIVKSENIDPVYKFCTTQQQINNNAGFVLESILIDYIKKYYNTHNISKKQENQIRDWLIEYFNYLADYFYEEFSKYVYVKKEKWNVSPYAFSGYIYLSKHVQNRDNWETEVDKLLKLIDFNIQNKPWKNGTKNPEKNVIKLFEEVINKCL